MIEFNSSRHFALEPMPHQIAGAKTLLKHPLYGLFWDMRLRKTSTVLAAAAALFDANELDALVIVSPAQVKDVWIDKKIGEARVHPALKGCGLHDFCARYEHVTPELNFNYEKYIVSTSFEFLRQEDRNGEFPKVELLLSQLKDKRYWLVIDEGEAISNPKALQTKATFRLRTKAARVTVLDGTPEGNSPLGLFTKFGILSKDILGYKAYHQFTEAHTVYIKKKFKTARFATKIITDYKDLEIIQQRGAPYCEVLKQSDVYGDLMKQPHQEHTTVKLIESTWRVYCELRDNLVSEIDAGQVTINNSATKVMRLAQVCAGFVGGVQQQLEEVGLDYTKHGVSQPAQLVELSMETCDQITCWLMNQLIRDPKFKVVIWCRFIAEIERLTSRLGRLAESSSFLLAQSWSKIKSGTALLHPANDTYDGAVILIAQPQANQYGLNFSKAKHEVWLSRDYNRVTFEQAGARFKAPDGHERWSKSVLVTGPQGQRTIVHDIVKSVLEKEEIGKRTVAQWRKVLTEE